MEDHPWYERYHVDLLRTFLYHAVPLQVLQNLFEEVTGAEPSHLTTQQDLVHRILCCLPNLNVVLSHVDQLDISRFLSVCAPHLIHTGLRGRPSREFIRRQLLILLENSQRFFSARTQVLPFGGHTTRWPVDRALPLHGLPPPIRVGQLSREIAEGLPPQAPLELPQPAQQLIHPRPEPGPPALSPALLAYFAQANILTGRPQAPGVPAQLVLRRAPVPPQEPGQEEWLQRVGLERVQGPVPGPIGLPYPPQAGPRPAQEEEPVAGPSGLQRPRGLKRPWEDAQSPRPIDPRLPQAGDRNSLRENSRGEKVPKKASSYCHDWWSDHENGKHLHGNNESVFNCFAITQALTNLMFFLIILINCIY